MNSFQESTWVGYCTGGPWCAHNYVTASVQLGDIGLRGDEPFRRWFWWAAGMTEGAGWSWEVSLSRLCNCKCISNTSLMAAVCKMIKPLQTKSCKTAVKGSGNMHWRTPFLCGVYLYGAKFYSDDGIIIPLSQYNLFLIFVDVVKYWSRYKSPKTVGNFIGRCIWWFKTKRWLNMNSLQGCSRYVFYPKRFRTINKWCHPQK